MTSGAGGRGRVRGIAGYELQRLTDGWEMALAGRDALDGPRALESAQLEWIDTCVPSTVAAALRGRGLWSLDGTPRRFDAEEWWYRTTFRADPATGHEQLWLCFDGLATVADAWLNGTALLSAAGMFTAHERRIDALLGAENELVLRFRSLDAYLAARRPRPRWRAPMVEHQQLRWHRTSLLGRTPGWSPPAAAVGPWREIRLERRRGVSLADLRIDARGDGMLRVSCRAWSLEGSPLTAGEFELEREGRTIRCALVPSSDGRLTAESRVVDVEAWHPHTHGASPLYQGTLRLSHVGGATDIDVGCVGFRSVSLSTDDDDFQIRVNGAPVFCRGACWTPLDPVTLDAPASALDDAFAQVVAAGMNMLRVAGTMIYESDAFLDRCDAHGVLLWQDFMFANMDYPDDADFVALAQIEARQQLGRLQGRPSLALLCGNSEVEQQAAMWGAPRERWQPALFHEHLAAVARDLCPAVPYWPSSAHGGSFPHQVNAGSTSYYGVGAYFGPIDDARRAEVRFASECLAFANVPEPQALHASAVLRGAKVTQSIWKERSPRDLGAGWDFDDVRDHYVAELFHVDPVRLRYSDHERYLALGRVATGEVMSAVFSEWRRAGSLTRGGLVWFLRDLWPGAGWGIIDAAGNPKAAWYYLRRALAPVTLSISDEGCNGLTVHVANDDAQAFDGNATIALYRDGDVRVVAGSGRVVVAGHGVIAFNAMSLLDGFHDLSYAYRFGPPSHDVVAITLDSPRGPLCAVHFIGGMPSHVERDVGLAAELHAAPRGEYEAVVRTRRFAQAIRIELDGFVAADNYFHLCPGEERRISLHRSAPPQGRPQADNDAVAFRGTASALNSAAVAPLALGASND